MAIYLLHPIGHLPINSKFKLEKEGMKVAWLGSTNQLDTERKWHKCCAQSSRQGIQILWELGRAVMLYLPR